jgi:phosphoribosylaminoimidazole carboxylase (NCAIR synthetase)
MNEKYINNQNSVLLYLDTRVHPLERQAAISAAKRQGYKLCIATSNPNGYKGYDVDYLINILNYKNASQIVINYIKENKINVTGIIAWKELEVDLAAVIGEELSLPHTDPKLIENVRNKAKTREVLDQFQGLNPDYVVVADKAQFIEGVKKIGVPCLLKQAGNSDGRGIRFIDTLDTALENWEQLTESNKQETDAIYHYYEDVYILEKKIIGTEHSIAGVVANGKVITFGIADKKIDHKVLLQYENIVPSRLEYGLRRKIVEIANKVISAVGINWCGFHLDFMVTDNHEIKILEVGGRLGGETINSHLIPLTQPGMSPYEVLIEVVQGRLPLLETDYTEKFSSQAASRAIVPPKPGVISLVSGIEKLYSNSHYRYFVQEKGVGDEVVGSSTKYRCYEIGRLIAQCDKSEDMEQVLLNLTGNVKVGVMQ